MKQSPDDARTRLQQAALELFGERGYDRTTASEIAARAGVTERTFFRHFPDKREALFDGEAVLRAGMSASIADAPADLAPLDVLFRAFASVAPLMEANRPFAEPRQRVIAAAPALAEREQAKLAALGAVLAAALSERGVEPLRAELTARAGMAAFARAATDWLDDPSTGLRDRLDRAQQVLRTLSMQDDG